MAKIRGIRGATIADDNTQQSILEVTVELLTAMVESNDIDVDDIAAAYFTTTQDLNAEFPAAAARRLGWNNTALLGGVEVDVPGSLNRCIRILILVNTDKQPEELVNVYLRGTETLRS